MKRTLSLRRETLGELDARDLSQVVGAALPSKVLADCLNSAVVCYTDRSGSQCTCPTE